MKVKEIRELSTEEINKIIGKEKILPYEWQYQYPVTLYSKLSGNNFNGSSKIPLNNLHIFLQ